MSSARFFDVLIYSPDRHVVYDGRTPYETGIGGGITARIRMARALSKAGQRVRVICNCIQPRRIDGVEYVPLDLVEPTQADVLLANTSGGDYDLGPMADLPVKAGLKLVWMSGVDSPAHLGLIEFDGVYAKSNFLIDCALDPWGIPKDRIWVFYNGFEESLYTPSSAPSQRHPFRLIYASHPSKGLDTALDITRRLRAVDDRFHLIVCGGEALWGRPEETWEPVPGIDFRGLLPQAQVAQLLQSSMFSLVLQSRPEPFGMVVTESQRAGCVVVASPVGAIPELVQHAINGVVISGDHEADSTRKRAVQSILDLVADPQKLTALQLASYSVPWSTDLIAAAWIEHWRALLDGWNPLQVGCPHCGSDAWRLADGVHCLSCRQYRFLAADSNGSSAEG